MANREIKEISIFFLENVNCFIIIKTNLINRSKIEML